MLNGHFSVKEDVPAILSARRTSNGDLICAKRKHTALMEALGWRF